jgi:PPOX class probable F420-dependent enzyme
MIMTISDEKYVASTTFPRSGTGVTAPTWIVPPDEGRVGFWTSSRSGTYKRLRNNATITRQPSDSRGRDMRQPSDSHGREPLPAGDLDARAARLDAALA